MADPSSSTTSSSSSTDWRRALEARVLALERLVTELSAEVVTRRLVVVDADDRARIVVSAEPERGGVLVRAFTGGETTAVELFAADPIDGERAEIGVAYASNGDVIRADSLFCD